MKMGKEREATGNAFFRELFQWGVYKKSQGRIARQVTFGVIALVVAIGARRWSATTISNQSDLIKVGLPVVAMLLGWWIAYRLVNMPTFADFLISVEAEMNKVTWPFRAELFRSSFVVILTIFSLALFMFGFDVIWRYVFIAIGVLRSE